MVFLDIFAKCDGNSVSSATTAMEDESLEVNYDQNPTKLYKLIEAQRWSPVLAEIAHNPDSTKVWVVRHDKKDNDNTGSIRWRMLPLHAAVVFNAPDPVMCMLIDAYPDAARQFDDRRMTPVSRILYCIYHSTNISYYIVQPNLSIYYLLTTTSLQ